jgi:tetratricopeptide (TPR) repeat protein
MLRGLLAFLMLLATASAWAQAPELDRARRHFEAGSQAFQRGDYPRAEIEFRGAYAITKDPLLYYNIGQSQHRRGHLEAAIKSYRSYLAGVPDAEDRAEVEGLIRGIEKELTAPKPVPTPGPVATPGEKPTRPTPAPSDDGRRARRQSAWILGATSVVALGLGAVFSVKSKQRADDANRQIDLRDPTYGRPMQYTNQQSFFEANRDLAAKWGGLAIGLYAVAAVGAGITTYLFVSSRTPKADREPRDAKLRIMPLLDPHNAGVVAGLEF